MKNVLIVVLLTFFLSTIGCSFFQNKPKERWIKIHADESTVHFLDMDTVVVKNEKNKELIVWALSSDHTNKTAEEILKQMEKENKEASKVAQEELNESLKKISDPNFSKKQKTDWSKIKIPSTYLVNYSLDLTNRRIRENGNLSTYRNVFLLLMMKKSSMPL